MKGIVVDLNLARDLVAYECDGDYGYFEILDFTSEYEREDVIVGNLKELGNMIITNETRKCNGKIAVEDYGMSLDGVKEAIS